MSGKTEKNVESPLNTADKITTVVTRRLHAVMAVITIGISPEAFVNIAHRIGVSGYLATKTVHDMHKSIRRCTSDN